MTKQRAPAPTLRSPKPATVRDWVETGPDSLRHMDPVLRKWGVVALTDGTLRRQRPVYFDPVVDAALLAHAKGTRQSVSAVIEAAVVELLRRVQKGAKR